MTIPWYELRPRFVEHSREPSLKELLERYYRNGLTNDCDCDHSCGCKEKRVREYTDRYIEFVTDGKTSDLNPAQILAQTLEKEFHNVRLVRVALELPVYPNGIWGIDVQVGSRAFYIEWSIDRPSDFRFSELGPEDSFSEAPDSIEKTPDAVVTKIREATREATR